MQNTSNCSTKGGRMRCGRHGSWSVCGSTRIDNTVGYADALIAADCEGYVGVVDIELSWCFAIIRARVEGLVLNCKRRLGKLETTRRRGGRLTQKWSEKQTCLVFTPYQLHGVHVLSYYWLSGNQHNAITFGKKKLYQKFCGYGDGVKKNFITGGDGKKWNSTIKFNLSR